MCGGCTYRHLYLWVHMCAYVWRSDIRGLPQLFSTIFFGTPFLTDSGGWQFSYAGWPTTYRDCPISASSMLGSQARVMVLGFSPPHDFRGKKPRSSCLYNKHFTNWALTPTRRMLFYLSLFPTLLSAVSLAWLLILLAADTKETRRSSNCHLWPITSPWTRQLLSSALICCTEMSHLSASLSLFPRTCSVLFSPCL